MKREIRSETTLRNRSALVGTRRYIVLVEMPAFCATEAMEAWA